MLTRRGFLGRLAGAVAAALASPALAQLSFPPAPVAVDAVSGISMRLIQGWEHKLFSSVTRMDVLYGFGIPSPALSARFADEPYRSGGFLAYVEKDREIQRLAAFQPCATCIRAVGASCRRTGRCLDESYRSAALDFKPDIFGQLWEA